MNDQSVEIKTIKLKLGGKEIELNVEQAKKLKSLLDEMFGKEIIREVVHDHGRYHWHWTSPPIMIPTPTPWMPAPPMTPIWIADSTGTISYDTSTSALSLTV